MAKLQRVQSSRAAVGSSSKREISNSSRSRSRSPYGRTEDGPRERPMSPNSNKWLDQLEYLCPDFIASLFPQSRGQGYNCNARTGTSGPAMDPNAFLTNSTEILEQITETYQCVHPQAMNDIQTLICSLHYLACQDFTNVNGDPFLNAIYQFREMVGMPGYVNKVRVEDRIQSLCDFVASMRKLSEFVLKSPPAELLNPRFRTAGTYGPPGGHGILRKSNTNIQNPYGQQSQGNVNNMMGNMGQSQQGMNNGMNQGMYNNSQQGFNQQGMNNGMPPNNQMGFNQQGMNNGMPPYNQGYGQTNSLTQMPQGNMNMNGRGMNQSQSNMDPNMYPGQQQNYPMDNGQYGGNGYNMMNQQNPSDNQQNMDGQQMGGNDINYPIQGNCKIDFSGVSSDNAQLEKMLNSAIANAFQKGYQCKRNKCSKPRRPRCSPAPNCGATPTLVSVPTCNAAPSCGAGGNQGNDFGDMFMSGKSYKLPPSITNFEAIRPLKIPGFDLYTQPNRCGAQPFEPPKCQQPPSCQRRTSCGKPPPAAWKKPMDSCKALPQCIPIQHCLPPPPPPCPPPQPQCIRKPRVPMCPVSRCPEPPGNILCCLLAPECDVRVRDVGCSNTNFCNHSSKCRRKSSQPPRPIPPTPTTKDPDAPPQEAPRRTSVVSHMVDVRNANVQTDTVERKDFSAQAEFERAPSFGGDTVGKAPSLPSVRGSGVFSNPDIPATKQNCSAVFRIRLEGPDFQCVAPTVEIERTTSAGKLLKTVGKA